MKILIFSVCMLPVILSCYTQQPTADEWNNPYGHLRISIASTPPGAEIYCVNLEDSTLGEIIGNTPLDIKYIRIGKSTFAQKCLNPCIDCNFDPTKTLKFRYRPYWKLRPNIYRPLSRRFRYETIERYHIVFQCAIISEGYQTYYICDTLTQKIYQMDDLYKYDKKYFAQLQPAPE